ncbi:MAG: dihydropyrimidinase [Candidatus Adiutrix sp.]|jgi:dihydropyrimidinase|nr:dihydropyrimidinase [Candidatus Adiutrix sp.]
MAEVLIKNGILVTAEGERPADIQLSGGLISAIGPDLSPPAGAELLDAGGLLVMPGAVDAHTHLDLSVGPAHVSDGWLAGAVAAAFGGNTSVIEHPGFGPEGCPLDYQLRQYRAQAGEAAIDYGLHGVFQYWDPRLQAELAPLVAAGYSSFKAYLTYDGRLNDEGLLAALKALGAAGGLMTVHAENHAIVSHLAAELGLSAPGRASSHPGSRPDYAEALAIESAVALARAAGDAPLYIVHLSTAAGLEKLRAARRAGQRVWAETCPQYLLLTDDLYRGDFEEALKYVMAPPLRRPEDVEALWEGLLDGSISTVATDHCSFSWREKKERAGGNVFRCPGGIPGVETRLPLLYSEGVLRRGMSRSRFVELVSSAPARLFGLKNKGDLKVGHEADILVFDPNMKKRVRAAGLHQAVDYTPFENFELRGWPKTVFLRGRKIVDGERFTGEPGFGRFIARQPFSRQN